MLFRSISQTILGDLSDTLNNNVSFSCWILNGSGTNLTPTLIISSANAYNNFTAVTQVASQNLGTIASGLWAFETATINLTGLANVNNGIKVSISFPSGSLASNTQSVNVSQCTLVPGTSYITYIDDFGLFSPLGFQPPFTPQNNIVLNGALDVWQEKTSYAGITGASSVAVADGFRATGGTGSTFSCTVSRDTGSAISPVTQYNPYIANALKVAVNTAQVTLSAGHFLEIANGIEGYVFAPLQGRPLSLQFWAKGAAGTYCVSLYDGTNSYILTYTLSATNTWQQFFFPNIPSNPSFAGSSTTGVGMSIRFCAGTGTTFQSTAGTWQSGNFLATSAQFNVMGSTSNIFEITGIQLEPGAVCTSYNYIPFPQMLQLCKRYYGKSYDYSVVPGSNTQAGMAIFTALNTADAYGFIPFGANMVSDPTVTPYCTNGTISGATDLNNGTNFSSVTVTVLGQQGFSVIVQGGSLLTAGHLMAAQWTADSRF